eukprot:TRINITY_DN69875_c0_g1_i1.p1 TRINITY_DN69875_c0_g1~~TRINITY_DN69875_c0_g1_i1.p1  ORF type:complete len:399 (-),score=61.44 TRINITY_DN69875_c0_g1_i1:30-1205(-)
MLSSSARLLRRSPLGFGAPASILLAKATPVPLVPVASAAGAGLGLFARSNAIANPSARALPAWANAPGFAAASAPLLSYITELKIPDNVFLTINQIFVIVGFLACVAFYTGLERKILSGVMRRLGPSHTGPLGIGQPLADGVKLLAKKLVVPKGLSRQIFFLLPAINWAIACSLGMSFLPGLTQTQWPNNLNILLFLVLTSIGTSVVFFTGMFQNNRFTTMASRRVVVQFCAFDAVLTLSFWCLAMGVSSLGFQAIANGPPAIFCFLPLFWIMMSAVTAEVNRPPFDLAEADQELVAGYHTEYGGITFALWYLGEYGAMVAMSLMVSTVFFADSSFVLKLFPAFLFLLLRATLPRVRLDQIWSYFMKYLFPIASSIFIVHASILHLFALYA